MSPRIKSHSIYSHKISNSEPASTENNVNELSLLSLHRCHKSLTVTGFHWLTTLLWLINVTNVVNVIDNWLGVLVLWTQHCLLCQNPLRRNLISHANQWRLLVRRPLPNSASITDDGTPAAAATRQAGADTTQWSKAPCLSRELNAMPILCTLSLYAWCTVKRKKGD